MMKKILTHPYFSLACVVSLLFILPRFGSAVMMVGCTIVLSAYVSALPDRFRSQNGSLTLAFCLLAVMWMIAVVITVFSLLGRH